MTNEALLVETEGHVATLTINRPEKRNSLTPDTLIKIYETLEGFSKGNDVRAIVFTGAGDKAFCAGYDISVIPTSTNPEIQEILRTRNPVELAMERIKTFPYPTIAMINGHTFGAGFNLAMCCDIRVGSENISMGMPPAKLGVLYHPEGIKQFIDVLGMARTREVFLTARTYRGLEAKEKGLVDYMVPPEELKSFTYNLAGEITLNAPLSLKGTKRILTMFEKAIDLTQEDLKECRQLIREAFNSEDLKEGQTAFLEKRKPVFKGR
jgi:enoyl-CoA hydratase/carnithine racemase